MIPVSVIIPTHQRRDLVVAAVASLTAGNYPEDKLEIVVVTDRCSDGTLEALRASFCDRIAIVDSPRPGQPAALNTGISAATGVLAIFIDDEMRAHPDFVEAHARAHENHSAPTAVTGYSPVANAGHGDSLSAYLARTYAAFHRRLESAPNPRDPRSLNGGNMSVRLDALRSIGGFNESYLFQRNDFELAARLIESGFEILYCPEARADQHFAVDSEGMVSRAEPRAQNDVRLAREFPWCREFLPFRRQLDAGPAQSRWKAAWLARHVLPAAFKATRTIAPSSVFLVRYEYATRYAIEAVRSAGGWDAWKQLSGSRT